MDHSTKNFVTTKGRPRINAVFQGLGICSLWEIPMKKISLKITIDVAKVLVILKEIAEMIIALMV